MKTTLMLSVLLPLTTAVIFAANRHGSRIAGDYLEVRSCDVYTGACVANAEMGLDGREGMLVWSVKQGAWNGVDLAGLKAIAVVRAEDTLGDVRYQPRTGQAVLILDDRATAEQREALIAFAKAQSGTLVRSVNAIESAAIDFQSGQCSSGACAKVRAGKLVEISTRCLGGKDHLCGNEENYYPPLTEVQQAFSAFTEIASFKGSGLGLTWEQTGKRSAYLAQFSR